jgi:hypothetical protein
MDGDQYFAKFAFGLCLLVLIVAGCSSSRSPLKGCSESEITAIEAIQIYSNLPPADLSYIELGEVQGHYAAKDRDRYELSDLAMKREAYETYGEKVKAIMGIRYSFYGGRYGNEGSWSTGTAISIKDTDQE